MKKIVFIGGTAYSGSTFLDMALSNGQGEFSCGEVNAIFYPYRKHHVKPKCGCGDPTCNIWTTLRANGSTHLYEGIFSLFPDVNVIVDSSKDPLWIHDRSKELIKQGYEVYNILIWKSPQEFFYSREKRHKRIGWRRAWINYHVNYFKMVEGWRSIKYYDLANSENTLRTLCEYIGVPYRKERSEYWSKQHHTLFGNSSAKIHLYQKGSKGYEECKTTRDSQLDERLADQERLSEHQINRYQGPAHIENNLDSGFRRKILEGITKTLESRDITQTVNLISEKANAVQSVPEELKASYLFELYHRAKRMLKKQAIKMLSM